ncbi:hypothetical protein DFH27DRAFT_652103 [Peziza echinospora]|nr:hypothetical protein DFH27DRAFT_652103 [Peziza echinospora]
METAPYREGMKLGQGFNTYLQKPLGFDAVTVTEGPNADPATQAYQRSKEAILIDDYSKLVSSMEITAAAAISGWGQTGEVNTDYLNRHDYETSDLTYQVHVSVRRQGNMDTNTYSLNWLDKKDPNAFYGDKYIAGFISGGDFYGRCSIRVINQSDSEAVSVAAKATFDGFGVTGSVSAGFKSNVDTLNKYSETSILQSETGGGTGTTGTTSSAAAPTSDIEALKDAADTYYDNAEQQNYRLYVILGDYETLPNFDSQFTPLDYTDANQESWQLFKDFTYLSYCKDIIEAVPTTGATEELTSQVLNQIIHQSEALTSAVKEISADPTQIENFLASRVDPQSIYQKILIAITTEYSVYNLITYPFQGRMAQYVTHTSVILPTTQLPATAKPFFKFKAFSYAHPDTTLISIGYQNDYITTTISVGTHLAPDVETLAFWAFTDKAKIPASAEFWALQLDQLGYTGTQGLRPEYAFMFDPGPMADIMKGMGVGVGDRNGAINNVAQQALEELMSAEEAAGKQDVELYPKSDGSGSHLFFVLNAD